MMILRVIGCIFLLLIVSVLLGRLLYGKKEQNFMEEWTQGFFLLLAIFEAVSLPAIYMKMSLKDLSFLMLGIVGLLCLVSLFLNGRKMVTAVRSICWKNPGILVWIAVILVILQTLTLGFGIHIDDDDAFYVATAVTAVDTNTLFQIDPYTGNVYDTFPARYVLSPFPLLGAVFGKCVGIRPTVFFHTVLPFLLIPMAYCVYALIGERIFGKNREKNALFLIFISAVNLYSGFSTWTQGKFLLVRIWQGKAVLASIILPFLIYFVLKYFEKDFLSVREWFCLFIIMIAGCFVSSMGIILGVIMIEAFAFLQAVRTRKLRLFLQTTLCCGFNIALAGIYLFIR